MIKNTVKGVVAALLPGRPPASEEAMRAGRRQKAAAVLQQSLRVERVGRSSVIAIAVRSGDPQLSARIARTYASSYLRSEEHTSELQSLMRISYAVFCLK